VQLSSVSQEHYQLTHVRAHTSAADTPSKLNQIADSFATASQTSPLLPPSVPIPTFFMDHFMLFSFQLGFIESSISSFVDLSLAHLTSQSLDTCHQPLPPLPLFDITHPPPYPYIKAPSAYSAVVQLYAWSGQLDTRLSLSTRLKGTYLGCPVLEDAHHFFVHCPKISSLRTTYLKRLLDTIRDSLRLRTLSHEDRTFIFDQVHNLFFDSCLWPSNRTAYYLGILPSLVPSSRIGSRMHTRVAHLAHIVCLQLAVRIWGEARCQNFPPNRQRVPTDKAVLLPPRLARLFPSSSSPSSPL
jgi:hypothetical protein